MVINENGAELLTGQAPSLQQPFAWSGRDAWNV